MAYLQNCTILLLSTQGIHIAQNNPNTAGGIVSSITKSLSASVSIQAMPKWLCYDYSPLIPNGDEPLQWAREAKQERDKQ